nr:MAG: helix-turn-helix domain protein [Bacteriophage sp.]
MNTNEEVINRITEIRKKNGLSINKLADKCGVNSANLSRSLAGKASLSDRVIYKIAHALNVSVDWLEKGIEPMFSPTVASPSEVGAGIIGSNINASNSKGGTQTIGNDAEVALWKKLYEDKCQEVEKANKRIDQLLSIIGGK